MATVIIGPFSLEKVVNAVEKVRQRLLKAAGALRSANIPYAVVGGNAVALWVSRVDESAVRNTQDVDLLVRRTDFTAVKMGAGIRWFCLPAHCGTGCFSR